MGAKKIRKQKEKKAEQPKKGNRLFIIGIVAVVLAIGVYLLMHFVIMNPNRTAKRAAEAAFNAVYSFDYMEFTKRTIYSDDCQKYLRMEADPVISQIEQEFESMSESEKDAFSMKVTGVSATEYGKDSDEFKSAVSMLLEQNPEAFTDDIQKVAKAEVNYLLTYNDDGSSEKGTETYWVFRVHGRWYCHPLLGEQGWGN